LQFLKISSSTTLSDLADTIGDKNVSNTLAINGLTRTKYIGKQFAEKCKNVIETADNVTWERQSAILNRFTSDSEVFEEAALQSQSGWKVLSNVGTFKGAIQLPDSVELTNSTDIIGGGDTVTKTIYEKVMNSLSNAPHYVDPAVFDNYQSVSPVSLATTQKSSGNIFEMFNIPWGDITLYDSLAGESIDFPVYPETLQDARNASYTTMPDVLYQYEPWQIYTGSGPRTQSYTFHFHRQMWTGDELDGKANELIRFCEACLYPEYNGSAVNTATVKLYVKGSTLISGIMSDVTVAWDGPIGQDGWYLECTLELTITEVAEQTLSHDVVKNFSLIG
jgi:hypothetical protein